MLSKKQIQDVCLAYSGSHTKCRYLAQDDNDWTKFYCAKKSSEAANIDVEIDNFIAEALKKGKDPKKENVPMGDNCGGYPVLRFIEQGYDKP